MRPHRKSSPTGCSDKRCIFRAGSSSFSSGIKPGNEYVNTGDQRRRFQRDVTFELLSDALDLSDRRPQLRTLICANRVLCFIFPSFVSSCTARSRSAHLHPDVAPLFLMPLPRSPSLPPSEESKRKNGSRLKHKKDVKKARRDTFAITKTIAGTRISRMPVECHVHAPKCMRNNISFALFYLTRGDHPFFRSEAIKK